MNKKLFAFIFMAIAGATLFVSSSSTHAEPWSETFDGAPSSPQAWAPDDWDIQYHTRNSNYWDAPEAMAQQHGVNCEAPPATHPASTWPGTVYQCANHVMTAINASDYGLIYLTPNRIADFSSGPVVIEFDMSTERRSARDWIDLIITPFEQNLALPLGPWFPDLQGMPDNAVHVDFSNNEGAPILGVWQNGNVDDFGLAGWNVDPLNVGIASGTNQAAVRQPFRLTLTSTSARFERLESATGEGILFWEKTFPTLNFTSGIVQIGHHSYTPWKDGNGGPQTWHWDNVSINPSIPFTMIKADTRYVTSSTQTVTFNSPSPNDSYLRFAANGTVEVSYDGGPWEFATRQYASNPRADHIASFWHPIPAGVQSVNFRFSPWDGWSGNYIAKDFSIWSLNTDTPPTNTPDPTATNTPVVPTATAVITDTPTSVPTAVPTSTPTLEPTATNTVEPTPTPFNDKCRQPDRNNADTGWTNVVGKWKQDPDGDWYCAISVRPF